MNRLVLILAIFGGVISSDARAEIDTPADAIRVLHQRAYCIVYQSSSASKILSVPPGSRAERALLRKLEAGCIGGAYHLNAHTQLIRGAIVEAILRLGDDNPSQGRRIRWVAPFAALSTAEVAALDQDGRVALSALDFAQCVYAAAPDRVRALLKTAPTYSPEQKAFKQLSEVFGPCLQQGVQITVSMPQLRGFLAEAAYRSIYAAGGRSMSSRGRAHDRLRAGDSIGSSPQVPPAWTSGGRRPGRLQDLQDLSGY